MFLKNKKYILDGGSGQTLLEMGLKPEGALWSATALIDQNLHSLILKMHEDFINAGSDMIVTCNFSVRKRRLEEYDKLHCFEEATHFAGLLAKKTKDEAKKNVLVAGSLPSQGIVYKADIVTDDKETFKGFYNTAKILNPNIDIFYLDVLTRINEIKIACEAIKGFNKPILIGVHLNNLGLLRSGETIEDVIKLVKNNFKVPVLAYQVSGEYSMIKNAINKKYVNKKIIVETLTSFKRAGASAVVTYFAEDVAKEL